MNPALKRILFQPWTPSRLRPVLWVDPSCSCNVLNGSGFSQLTDKSGLGHHLVQATAAAQPLITRRDNKGNLLRYSEDLTQAAWGKVTGGTGSPVVVTLAAGIDPLGGSTAIRLQCNKGVGTGSSDQSYINNGVPLLGAGTRVLACWLKTYDGSTKTVYFRCGGTSQQVSVTGAWQEFTLTGSISGDADANTGIGLRGGASSETADLLVWHPLSRASDWDSDYIATGANPQFPGRNGLALARFDGVDDYLKAVAFPLNQPETVVGVFMQETWTTVDSLFDGNSGNSMRVFDDGVSPRIVANSGTQAIINNNLAVGSLAVVHALFNGASSQISVNRTAAATGNPGANNGGGFTLGAYGSGAAGFANIRTGDVFIFDRILQPHEQDRLIRWLADKWAISI